MVSRGTGKPWRPKKRWQWPVGCSPWFEPRRRRHALGSWPPKAGLCSAASPQRQDHLHDPADVALFPISLAGVGVFVVAFHASLVHDVGRGVAQRGDALILLEMIIGAR